MVKIINVHNRTHMNKCMEKKFCCCFCWCACYPLKSCKKRILCSTARFLGLADWVNWRNKGIEWVYEYSPHFTHYPYVPYQAISVEWKSEEPNETKEARRMKWWGDISSSILSSKPSFTLHSPWKIDLSSVFHKNVQKPCQIQSNM